MQQQQSSAANNVFDQLRNLPNFDSIRLLVQQHPQFLQQVLQQLSQSNPQMFQLITQNQQEFIRLLNEPVPPDTPFVFFLRITMHLSLELISFRVDFCQSLGWVLHKLLLLE